MEWLIVILVPVLAYFGAWMGVRHAEKFFARQEDNKLYDTVFAGPPEPAGDEDLSKKDIKHLAEHYQQAQECDSPEPGATPFRNSGRGRKVEDVGWPKDSEETKTEIWPVAPTQEIRPLPGDLGTRR